MHDTYVKPGPHQQQCRSNVRLCWQNGNNVERVLRWNFVLSTKSNVASTLLLVWTGLNTPSTAVHRDRTCANAGTDSNIQRWRRATVVDGEHTVDFIDRTPRSHKFCRGRPPSNVTYVTRALSSVHTYNNVEATLSKLRWTLSKQHSTLLPQKATMSNEYRKISSFRHSRMLLRRCCRFGQQCCRFRQQCRTKFCPFDKVETNWTWQCRSNIRHCRKDEILQ